MRLNESVGRENRKYNYNTAVAMSTTSGHICHPGLSTIITDSFTNVDLGHPFNCSWTPLAVHQGLNDPLLITDS